MNSTGRLLLSGIGAMVLLVGLACAGGGLLSTPTPVPTPIPPTAVPPTATATVVAPVISGGPFEIDPTLYVHKTGAFSLFPPLGWSADEGESDVLFLSPDNVGAIYAAVTNTGYQLDADAFSNFVDATETNFFGYRDQYQVVDTATGDGGKNIVVQKTFLFNGVPQEVITLYRQVEGAIYSFDFWVDEDKFDAYSDAYLAIAASIQFNPAAASALSKYSFIYTFTGPDDLFTIEVPSAWIYSQSAADAAATIDTFIAPDGKAFIENVAIDDGTTRDPALARDAALAIINQRYSNGANDIAVSEEVPQDDGSIRLTWTSDGSGFYGQTFYEVRNSTTLLLFTVSFDSTLSDVYLDVVNYTVSTYTTP
ncbi:MAG: hypothetical protein AB1564_03750 [Chloroflexota bacterium]